MPLFTLAASLMFILRSHVFFAKTRLFLKDFLQRHPLILRKPRPPPDGALEGQEAGRSVEL